MNSLFESQLPLSQFTIRDYKDFKNTQYKPLKQLITRINGELCIFNTIEIIKRYKPKYYVIENPAYGRIWAYIDKILGFKIPYENLTFYSAYDYEIQKPTKFKSNVDLKLRNNKVTGKIHFSQLRGYNNRSNIPLELIREIYTKLLKQ